MHAHVFQHASFEGIGAVADWLHARSAEVTFTRFFESAELPALEGLDLLVVMGGPMSATDEAGFPWLADEKRFIAQAIAREVPVLGICLGAQLVAAALGARVYRGKHLEIGWFPVTKRETDAEVFPFPARALTFHWHGDTFDIPAGAVRLASSEAFENQAFQFGRRTIALQCHFEMTPQIIESLLANSGSELAGAPFVQSADQLRAQPSETFEEMATLLGEILGYLTESGRDLG